MRRASTWWAGSSGYSLRGPHRRPALARVARARLCGAATPPCGVLIALLKSRVVGRRRPSVKPRQGRWLTGAVLPTVDGRDPRSGPRVVAKASGSSPVRSFVICVSGQALVHGALDLSTPGFTKVADILHGS